MRRVCCLAAAFLLAVTGLSAQAPLKIGLVAGLQRGYGAIKGSLKEAADKMPAADYAFQPAPDAWSFGRLIGHIANAQFTQCARAKGEADPNEGTDNEKKVTKAELIKALNDSFVYCDRVFASLTDQTAMQFVAQDSHEVSRGLVLSNFVAHSNEMYGIGVVYLRLKGFSVGPMHAMQMRH